MWRGALYNHFEWEEDVARAVMEGNAAQLCGLMSLRPGHANSAGIAALLSNEPPLSVAARLGWLGCVEALLEDAAAADGRSTADVGISVAMHGAATHGHVACLKLLLAAGGSSCA